MKTAILGEIVAWSQRYFRPILVLILIGITVIYGKSIMGTWHLAKGYEYEWVAQSLAAGKGFSFDGRHRWLFHNPIEDPQLSYRFEPSDPEKHFPTAWMEPVYTSFMAIWFAHFGEYGRIVLLGFNLLFVFLTAWIIFLIGKRIWGLPAGVIAVILLLITIYFNLGIFKRYIGNVWATGFLVCLCCLALVWCIEKLSVNRALVVGGLIGFTALTHSGTLLFAGLASLTILTMPESLSMRCKAIAGIFLAVILVVSPWTIRNYFMFDHFIPIRTGGGYVLYKGNVVLGVAIDPSLRVYNSDIIEMWEAPNAYQAVKMALRGDKKSIMHVFSKQMVEANAPSEFSNFNEHERDQVYKAEAVSFMRKNPWLTVRLMIAKALFYLFYWGILETVIAFLAVIGAIMLFQDIRSRAVIFLLAGLAAPYVISQPIYYRYRYPAEPLFILLASGAIVRIIEGLDHCFGQRRVAPKL
jgi:hypothetical protein